MLQARDEIGRAGFAAGAIAAGAPVTLIEDERPPSYTASPMAEAAGGDALAAARALKELPRVRQGQAALTRTAGPAWVFGENRAWSRPALLPTFPAPAEAATRSVTDAALAAVADARAAAKGSKKQQQQGAAPAATLKKAQDEVDEWTQRLRSSDKLAVVGSSGGVWGPSGGKYLHLHSGSYINDMSELTTQIAVWRLTLLRVLRSALAFAPPGTAPAPVPAPSDGGAADVAGAARAGASASGGAAASSSSAADAGTGASGSSAAAADPAPSLWGSLLNRAVTSSAALFFPPSVRDSQLWSDFADGSADAAWDTAPGATTGRDAGTESAAPGGPSADASAAAPTGGPSRMGMDASMAPPNLLDGAAGHVRSAALAGSRADACFWMQSLCESFVRAQAPDALGKV
jgi:hypothetical protein